MSEEWSTVDVKEDSDESSKVEFEVEEQEEEQELKAAPVVEQVENNEEEEQPEELEGIKTKGAEKRIKQLIRQRKERDEELQQLRSESINLRSAVQ